MTRVAFGTFNLRYVTKKKCTYLSKTLTKRGMYVGHLYSIVIINLTYKKVLIIDEFIQLYYK